MRIRSTVTSTAVLTSVLCLLGAGTAQAATASTPWAERVVRHTNVSGHTASTTLMPLDKTTTLSTTVTGTVFASCFHEDALTGKPVERSGSQKNLGAYSTGANTTTARAGATKAKTLIVDIGAAQSNPVPAGQLACRSGEYARWSGMHAARVTTTRYAIKADGSCGAILGVYTGVVETSLQF